MTHTITELKAMSDYEIDVVVAVLEGWTEIKYLPISECVMGFSPDPDIAIPVRAPKWSTDIDAAYELEASVPQEKRHEYSCWLGSVLGSGWTPYDFAHAPARIRSDAYVLTMEGMK